MTKYSLRARMMILILAPTLFIGLLLSAFFVVHRYNELQHQLVDAGASIIEPLALSSEYGMTFHNRESVRHLVNLLHRHHSDIVRSISLFDANNTLFVTSNYQQNMARLKLPDGAPMPEGLTLLRTGPSLIMRTPIVREGSLPDGERAYGAASDAIKPLGYIAIELDMDAVRLQQYKEAFVSTLLLLLCLCCAGLFAYRLMRDVTGPIRNMVNTVDRIRRGQLDNRVEGYMLGELDMLKNGINAMAMSLSAYHEELQQNIDQATPDLRETLEQMEIQNVELDLAKKRAQEAVRIKSEFLANMSHELRTPLNGVIGFTRQTLKTPLSPTQRDYLQTIERSGNHLLSIINDVLDFSKLEAGKLMLETIPFALRAILDEVVILLAHTAHEKGLELILQVQREVPEYVIGDPLRLQQVMTNLIGNAIKFTEQGHIIIRVGRQGHERERVEINVQIRDTGIGIAERQQSQLFQAFRQADASITRRHGGTGLGLVITQKLVREMGGEINFRSRIGRGSTFWFHIPLQINCHAWVDPHRYDALMHKHLALIESNSASAQATLELLADTPLEVSHYPDLNALGDAQGDILLIGKPITATLSLPEMRYELLQASGHARCIILALPGAWMVEAELLKQMGADACLTKPVSGQRLLALLQSPPALRPSGEPEASTPCLPLTVMAVDDNPANLKLIGALLQEQVEQTILCNSAAEAIAYAQKKPLDIILMDIQMLEIDGLRAAELIRQLPLHAHTPIVAVTAHTISDERQRLLDAGMVDCLAKPIDEAMLRRLLSRYGIHDPASLAPPREGPSDVRPPPVPSGNQDVSLDWQLALRQAADKPDLAREMLGMLLEFLPEIKQRVEAVASGAHDEHIGSLIHKLHGSCSYSGVPRLRRLCANIEQQLRSGVEVAALEPEWLAMLDEIENVRIAARAWLSG